VFQLGCIGLLFFWNLQTGCKIKNFFFQHQIILNVNDKETDIDLCDLQAAKKHLEWILTAANIMTLCH